MRAARLLTVFAVLCLASATMAAPFKGARVLHVNAELVRQQTGVGVHRNGYNQVGRFMRREGAEVRRVHARDLGEPKTRLDLARLGNPQAVTISATMTMSVQTVRHLVMELKAQGMKGRQIIIGGRAMTAAHATKWGVQRAKGAGEALKKLVRQAR